ncbi:MAG TPA: tRNA lysidine(34) synthetase TilS, partial [Phycisphaerales bacterium]|nr:tRNA lysidine(34) synthetase TilS [Phycisphaerales bacterium]
YEFFLSAARRIGARAVATAHHADDNVETILYRIVRGTHLRGLAGIPAVRRLGGSNVRLVRPLLEVTRAEIEAFLRARNLAWRQDSTNADTLYRRNFIRNELLPLLRNKLNARADDALLRLSAAAAEAEEFLAAQAGELLGNAWRAAGPTAGEIDLAALGEAPPILRRYVVRGALERVGAPLRMIGAERLMQLGALAAPGGSPTAVTLPGGFRIRRVGESLRIEPVSDVDAAEPLTAVTLCVPGVTDLGDGRSVICEVEPFDAEAFRRHCLHRPDGEELLDADAIRGRLLARGRQRGDAFVPLGCPGRQTVSDFLTNAKLPRTRRDRAVCISDETGLVYLAPLRIDDRVKVTAATRRVLRLRLEEIEDRRPTAPARTALPS